MAKKQDVEQKRPAEPALVSPRREAVVEGASVTFSWEPVEEATEYRLQVATDNHLDDVIYEEHLGVTTEHTVSGVFETDGRTYFWNVWAKNEAGRSSDEEYVESFVSTTKQEAEQVQVTPEANDDEDYGPAGELVRAASAEVAAEVTGDEAYHERERELGVAHEGVEAGQIMAIALGIALFIIVLVIILFQVTDLQARQQREAVVGSSGYPELQETRQQATEKLNNYGVVEGENDAYRIPIDQAMNLMVNEAQQQRETTEPNERLPVPEN